MTEVIKIVLSAFIGYLVGSINTSIIVGKLKGADIRTQGSGNAGATNTLRVLGKSAAVVTILGDVLKGVIACRIGFLMGGELGLMIGGVFAILGHNWPLYFKFKGGKGVLTSFTVMIMMDWKISLLLFGLFLIIVALSRYISLGSICAAIMLPIISISGIFGQKTNIFIGTSIFLALLIVWRHSANIKRLVTGTESKFGSKKKS